MGQTDLYSGYCEIKQERVCKTDCCQEHKSIVDVTIIDNCQNCRSFKFDEEVANVTE